MNGGAKFQFFQFEDANGIPYASAKLYHYAAGTTTDKDIWSDENKATPTAQPLIADSRGITTFYADGDYKFVLKDSSDNTLYTWDNINITSDLATMWEGNHGTAYPTAAAANIWQLFAKHTAGNVLQEIGINNGSAFVPLYSPDKDTRYVADTGAADAYAVTLSPVPTAYTAGMVVIMKATNANTGASTINVNSLGLKSIKKDGSDALIANDILAGHIICLIYDGTNFQLASPSGESVYEDAVQTLTNKTITTPAVITSTLASGSAPLVVASTTQVINLNVDQVDGLDAGAAVANYVRGITTHVHDNGVLITGWGLHTSIAEDAWESIGPTGSGSDNIWTTLDAVPSTAKALILKIYIDALNSAGSSDLAIAVYMVNNSVASPTADVQTIVAYASAYTAGTTRVTANVTTAYISVDSSIRFKARWGAINQTTAAANIFLVGWIE